jgi:hypothetical protein
MLRLVADLREEALPVFLVAAVTFFEVFQDTLEVSVAFEFAPGRVDAEPRVVFVAEIDGAAKPVESFGLVAFEGEVCG